MIDVAITGMGTIGAWGSGELGLAEALQSGSMPMGELDDSVGFHRNGAPRRAHLVPKRVTAEWIPMLVARRMSLPSRLAVSSARMALLDAQLGSLEEPFRGDEQTAVVLGNPWGSTDYTQRLLEQLNERGPQGISPYLFMETVANAPAGQVALATGAAGSNTTFTMREASDLAAIGRGATLVASGRATRVLAGGVGEISPVLHGVFSSFGALSPTCVAKPLSAEADGLVAAEGATVMVLEPTQTAEQRSVPIRCRVRACATATDVSATSSDWGTGAEPLARSLVAMLDRSGIELSSIDLVISGASGTRRGDQLERDVLIGVFGKEVPPVVVPKAITGEYGGGFLGASLWSLRTDALPPHLMATTVGSLRDAGSMPVRRALVTTLASGGPAAWVVLDRP